LLGYLDTCQTVLALSFPQLQVLAPQAFHGDLDGQQSSTASLRPPPFAFALLADLELLLGETSFK